jgi:hypothetical protein
MAINQTWKINRINVWDSILGLTDVISEVQWEIITEEPGYQRHSANGITRFSAPDPSTFVQYNNVSEAQIIQWVKDILGSEKVAEYQRAGWDYMGYTSTTETVKDIPWAG